MPKNGAFDVVMFPTNIKKDPENMPTTEPTSPMSISKFLETIVVGFI
jgi:hypothetical protein